MAKQRILTATESDTLSTHVFDIVQRAPWPDEFPGRALRNEFMARWHARESGLERNLEEVAPAFESARTRGDYHEAHVYAGQAVGLIDDLPRAANVLIDLAADAEAALQHSLDRVLSVSLVTQQ